MAPTSGKKPAAKKSAAKKTDKKKAKKGVESYKLYIFKVLKQVHPDTGISSKAMAILNSFIADQFEKIASQAAQVCFSSDLLRASGVQSGDTCRSSVGISHNRWVEPQFLNYHRCCC
jgi:hypothetical protein